MSLRRMIPVGSLAAALTVAALAVADEVVLVPGATVKQAAGGRVRGTIQSESPSEVVVRLGANTITVPTDQVASIRYDSQPASMTLAETNETGAQLARLIKSAAAGSVRHREARLAKAESLAGLKKYAEAEADVRDVIKTVPPEDAPAQSAAYNTLGDCLRAAGRPKDALLAYLHT